MIDERDAVLARLLALHPKRIDLSLDRMRRLLDGSAVPSTTAAGHPCRRHQRQGLDHRLHARHAGGSGQAGACLHLAASGPFPRAHPAGSRAADVVDDEGSPMRSKSASGQCRRADHAVRDHHRRGVHAVPRHPADSCSSRSASAAAQRDQRRRPAARAYHADLDGPRRISSATRREDRRRKGRHHEARRAGDRRGAEPTRRST